MHKEFSEQGRREQKLTSTGENTHAKERSRKATQCTLKHQKVALTQVSSTKILKRPLIMVS